jgi:hypothetical protein
MAIEAWQQAALRWWRGGGRCIQGGLMPWGLSWTLLGLSGSGKSTGN